jgi:hypothetical protein
MKEQLCGCALRYSPPGVYNSGKKKGQARAVRVYKMGSKKGQPVPIQPRSVSRNWFILCLHKANKQHLSDASKFLVCNHCGLTEHAHVTSNTGSGKAGWRKLSAAKIAEFLDRAKGDEELLALKQKVLAEYKLVEDAIPDVAKAASATKKPALAKHCTGTAVAAMTFEVKMNLRELLDTLGDEGQAHVVYVLSSAGYVVDGVIDLDAYDQTTLWRLYEYVTPQSGSVGPVKKCSRSELVVELA